MGLWRSVEEIHVYNKHHWDFYEEFRENDELISVFILPGI